jgi:excisionase family DNA binding protein
MTIDVTRYMSVSEAARRLGRSESQIKTLIDKGDLQSTKVFGRRVIVSASVEHYALPRSPIAL